MSRVRFPDPVSCGLSLLLVLLLGLGTFSLGTPVFPSPQKPTFPNSNSIWIFVKHFYYHEPLAWVISQALPVFDIKFTFFYINMTLAFPDRINSMTCSTPGGHSIHWATTRTHGEQGHLTEFICDRHPAFC